MMVRIRIFEERLAKDFADGKVPGFFHLSVGQEANPAGVCANPRDEKNLIAAVAGLTA